MPLNPALYQALCRLAERKGSPPPTVNHPNEGFTYSVIKNSRGHWIIHPESGEEYQMDCPFCTDTRKRFSVNYMYGMPSPDPRVIGRMIHLAFCQNEQEKKCELFLTLKDYEWAVDHGLVNLDDRGSMLVPQKSPFEQVPPSMGETVPLASRPDSEHYRYWVYKGYDPEYLTRFYRACIPVEHPDVDMWEKVKSRTIFPYFYNGKVIMWQGRLTYDHADKFPPKWWFPGGTHKVFHNIDLARQFPVCLICEGISSELAVGPAAMAIGGKTMNNVLAQFLKENWEAVMVMLDPDAGINRKPKPGKFTASGNPIYEPDYQERMIKQLTDVGVPVTSVKWTKGDNRDPGDHGPAGCARLIKESDPAFAKRLSYLW